MDSLQGISKSLGTHNMYLKCKILQEICKILAVAKLRKFLVKDCVLNTYPVGITSFILCVVTNF